MRRAVSFRLLLAVCLSAVRAAADSPGQIYGPRTADNSVYLEAGGPGLIYSLDYDRVLSDDFAARIGCGLVLASVQTSKGKTSTEPALLSVPLTVSYIGSGSRWTMLEIGAGLIVLHAEANVKTVYVEKSTSALTSLIATALVGVRYQPPDGGFTFRAGVTVLEGRYGFFPLWPYASGGLAF